MQHTPTQADLDFYRAFEQARLSANDFHHREHLRIAYVLLAGLAPEQALSQLERSILHLLDHLGAPRDKYHITQSYAWLLAVYHFMHKVGVSNGFEEFIAQCPELLDQRIMLSHYSEAMLFSHTARTQFVEPDISAIPRYC